MTDSIKPIPASLTLFEQERVKLVADHIRDVMKFFRKVSSYSPGDPNVKEYLLAAGHLRAEHELAMVELYKKYDMALPPDLAELQTKLDFDKCLSAQRVD